jgi:hypothetical protein
MLMSSASWPPLDCILGTSYVYRYIGCVVPAYVSVRQRTYTDIQYRECEMLEERGRGVVGYIY